MNYSEQEDQFDRLPKHRLTIKNCVVVNEDGSETPIPDRVIYSDDPISGNDLIKILGRKIPINLRKV